MTWYEQLTQGYVRPVQSKGFSKVAGLEDRLARLKEKLIVAPGPFAGKPKRHNN